MVHLCVHKLEVLPTLPLLKKVFQKLSLLLPSSSSLTKVSKYNLKQRFTVHMESQRASGLFVLAIHHSKELGQM